MTTFRDLALAADKHLLAATSRVGVLSQADAAQVAGDLAMLSRICGRVLDDVLDGFPERAAHRRAEGAAWRAAANSARTAVRASERRLEWAAAAYGPKDGTVFRRVRGLSAPLRSAIDRLGLAEEMLQTELSPGAPGSRRPKRPGPHGLGDPDTVREITGLTGRWIGLVGVVAEQVAGQVQVPYRLRRVNAEPISKVFQQSAAHARRARGMIIGATGPATQLSERLAQFPTEPASTHASGIGAGAGTGPGNGPGNTSAAELIRGCLGQACDQASALGAALHAGKPRYPGRAGQPGPVGSARSRAPVSARSLRYVATAAGSVHTAAAIIARQLAARTAELAGTTGGGEYQALTNAADALIETGRAWNAAARHWDHVLSRDLSLSDAAAHATGTVMLLGRAAYADPDWTPASPNTAVRPAAEFAADLGAVHLAAAHLDYIITAYTGAARTSSRAITALHGRKTLYAELGDRPTRASHAHVADLRDAYDAVVHSALKAERWLHTATAPHPVPARQTPARQAPAAPALVAADFPDQPLAGPDSATPAQTTAPALAGPTPAAAPAATAATAATAANTPAPVPVPAAAHARPARRTR